MDGRDFLQIADKLEESSSNFERRFKAQLKRVLDAAVAIHEAWSGSNLGYQANVYYDGFRKPPAGAQFSVMHGIGEDWLSDTLGDWGRV
ncbi:hypothetical protein LZK76_35870 (plasmid) [Rhizobium leguminosarum]|nr:hypothetical protein LZK76_35870 [Rhizobium leguminosarum]